MTWEGNCLAGPWGWKKGCCFCWCYLWKHIDIKVILKDIKYMYGTIISYRCPCCKISGRKLVVIIKLRLYFTPWFWIFLFLKLWYFYCHEWPWISVKSQTLRNINFLYASIRSTCYKQNQWGLQSFGVFFKHINLIVFVEYRITNLHYIIYSICLFQKRHWMSRF